MNSGIHGQRGNMESDTRSQAQVPVTEGEQLTGLRALLVSSLQSPPHSVYRCRALRTGLPISSQRNDVQDGQGVRNPSQVTLADVLL